MLRTIQKGLRPGLILAATEAMEEGHEIQYMELDLVGVQEVK